MSFILCQEFIDLFKAKQDGGHGRRKTQDGSIEKGRFVNADLKREGILKKCIGYIHPAEYTGFLNIKNITIALAG